MSGRIGAADHRADRGADHHIGDDAMGNQRPDDAYVGKPARGAAAQRQPDHRPPDAAKSYLVAVINAVFAPADQNIQHLTSPGGTTLLATARPHQNVPQAWFMPRSGWARRG